MAEPSRIRADITDELAARRTMQRERGEEARERDYDRLSADATACEGECTGPGSTRGGGREGNGRLTAGMVAVDEHGLPLDEFPDPGDGTPPTRPCFDCNRDRWEAWQKGEVALRVQPKVEAGRGA